ncbi:MAG: alpha/beta hydrolase [Bacteroidetes bacterium]|nr:MAG: alpha/beta hydrolase [Bacteroidota bacterium]
MKSWTYPYPVHEIVLADSLRMAYVDEGEGPVLLFVHGLGSNLKAWTKNIDSLKSRYRCLAIDLPGYGRSSRGNYPYTMSFFSEAIAHFVTALDLSEVHLIGHSMGGQIAILFSLQYPEVLSRMTLLAPAGFETFSEMETAWFEQVYTPEFLLQIPEDQIIHNFEINFAQMPADARFMIEDRLALRDSLEDYQAYCKMIPKCVLGMLREPVADRLRHIAVPTQVIFGEQDRLIPNSVLHPQLTVRSVAESGQAHIPNSRLELIPNTGHFVQWEASQRINRAIIEWQEKE